MRDGWKSYLDPAALRFVGLFVVLVVALSWIAQTTWVDLRLIGPYTTGLASIATFLWCSSQCSSQTSGVMCSGRSMQATTLMPGVRSPRGARRRSTDVSNRRSGTPHPG